VKEFLVHHIDYNLEALFALPHKQPMRIERLRSVLLLLIALLLAARLFMANGLRPAYAQAATTPTLNGASQPYITNTYTTEPFVNVRAGPSSVYYGDPIGQLPVNATAPALAITAGHDWIEIAFPSGPNGVGWVYAPFVTLVGSPPVIEPPPTFTPPPLSTLDPTLLAQFTAQPSATRLPTYTPAPPLVVPTFSDAPAPQSRFPFASIIAGLVLLGLVGLTISFLVSRG
jgi:hypothetical protein